MHGLIPPPLERLLKVLARLPGLGPRSAQRAALALLTNPGQLDELVRQLGEVKAKLQMCARCGNVALAYECGICTDPSRDAHTLCVVEGVADLWALERGGHYKGRYHVLGGVLNPLAGVGPEEIRLPELADRVAAEAVREVIMALPASVEGQTTAHLIQQRLAPTGVRLTSLAKGVPVGASVDYLDEGTLALALAGRQPL